VLRHRAGGHTVRAYSPYGYDERQFCSPGFDLGVGCLMRTPWGEFPEYHTSADDLSYIDPASLADSLDICRAAIDVIERDATWVNLSPNCEPQLGRRGLYDAIGGAADPHSARMAILWVLNGSDGSASLLEIAERASMPFAAIADAADALRAAGLLAPAPVDAA
jgi:aminopeptidase-like protein